MAESVLLLELIAADRFHRGVAFPFLRGYLRARGAPCGWLRFALDAGAREGHLHAGTALPTEDIAFATAALCEAKVTHVLFNIEPAPDLVGALRGCAPALRAGHLTDDEAMGDRSDVEPIFPDRPSVDGFLGWKRGDAQDDNLFATETPDFGWTAGNELARTAPPLPFLVCGPECTYARSLASNPHFTGVDLEGCVRKDGCAFCTRLHTSGSWHTDPLSLFERQLHALRDSHPRWSGQLAVRAVGEPIFRNLERVAAILRSAGVDSIALLVDARADTIVRRIESLRAAVVSLEGTAHAIHLALIGIESFSDDDLRRLNKGLTFRESLRAVQLLLALERDFPGHFSLREHGGLSLLLFTPWTTLEDLALNFAILRQAKLLPLCGKAFSSRLRLYPTLPVHALAARDGLLADRYDDVRFDTARRNFYPDEVPWRFRDPRVEAVSSLCLDLDGAEPDASVAPLVHAGGALHAAQSVVDVAMARDTVDADVLRRHALVWVEAQKRPTPGTSEAAQVTAAQSATETSLLALDLGLKPVVRLEPDNLVHIDVADLVRRYPVVVRRMTQRADRPEPELFVGTRESDVRDAIAWTDQLERPRSPEAWYEAARAVGAALGYPSCCVEAYVALPPFLRDRYAWADLARRMETPGPVSPLLHPVVQLVGHLPCSLGCRPTLDAARAIFDALSARAAGNPYVARVENPWLLFFDREREGVELLVDGAEGDRLRYRAGAIVGRHPLAARIGEGDELNVGEQKLTILREGKPHAELGARAFLWWHQASYQHAFLRLLLDLRLVNDELADASPPQPAPSAELCRVVRSAVDVLQSRIPAFHGYRVELVEPAGHNVRIVLAKEASCGIEVLVALRERRSEGYVFAGPLTLYHPHDCPIDTLEKDRAVRLLAAGLERVFRARRATR